MYFKIILWLLLALKGSLVDYYFGEWHFNDWVNLMNSFLIEIIVATVTQKMLADMGATGRH